jgi:phosphonate transport system substrate-binding protein
MSSSNPDVNPPDPPIFSPHPTEPRLSPRRVLLAALPLVAIVTIAGSMVYHRSTKVNATSLSPGMIPAARMRLTKGLDPKFKDADKDLVADPPADPTELVDPETLVFSYIATDDPKVAESTWKPLMDRIASATGKTVKYLTDVHDAEGQIEAMKQGKLHVTGFNTGNVPRAVNLAGFVPSAVMAAPDGSYSYEMEIIVPAGSHIESPAGLAGHVVTFTDLGSNSGFKAPLVLLRNDFHLEPGINYDVNVSYGHERSIEGIASGKFQAAAVANEVLKRAISKGLIKESGFRSIYKSEGFPPACIGSVYNLKPELAEKIRAAILSFDWKGTTLENAYGASGKAKFVPISYKDQWSFVRYIDDEIGRMPGF